MIAQEIEAFLGPADAGLVRALRAAYGYKQLFQSALCDGELGAESRRPSCHVGFSTDFDCSAPESRRGPGSRFSSARDPERKSHVSSISLGSDRNAADIACQASVIRSLGNFRLRVAIRSPQPNEWRLLGASCALPGAPRKRRPSLQPESAPITTQKRTL